MSEERDYGFDTRALHAGQRVDPVTGARAVPIHQTVAYVFEDTEHAADLFDLNRFGNIYTRIMNPTTAVFEERMASLEGGVGALATASGLAAQAVAITTLLEAGDHVVASRHLYGGSHNQLAITLARLGIRTTFVDPADMGAWREAVEDRTRLLYGETIGNPRLDVLDIAAVAEVAGEAGVPFLIDNTFATPYLCRPMEHGAHLVSHSATKWICGHGTTIGGVLVDSGTFPWQDGRFPGLVEPSPGYRGLRYAETFGNFAFVMKARVETMRDLGPVLSPFNAFLLLQGLETLSLRMDRHVASTVALAEFLRGHPGVEWVTYPGLPDSPERDRVARYLPLGAGGVLTFGVRGGRAAGEKLIEACELLLAPRERRRREVPDHPPRLHHPPPPGRGGPGACRGHGGHGAHLRGAGDARRHHVGPRPRDPRGHLLGREAPEQGLDPPADLVADRPDLVQAPRLRRVGELPVLVARPREEGARVPAPHRHHDVGCADRVVGERRGEPLRHVEAELGHDLDHHRVHPIGGLRPRGPHHHPVPAELLREQRRHLGAAGVVDADVQHLGPVVAHPASVFD